MFRFIEAAAGLRMVPAKKDCSHNANEKTVSAFN